MNVPLSRDRGCQHVNIPQPRSCPETFYQQLNNNQHIWYCSLHCKWQHVGWTRMGDFIRVIPHKRCFDHLQIQFLHSQTKQGRRSPCITLPGNTGLYLVHLARTWRTLGSRLSIHRLTGQYWQMQRFMANVWRPSETRNSTFYLILSEPFDFCEINVFIFLICQLAAGLMGRSSGHFLSAQF